MLRDYQRIRLLHCLICLSIKFHSQKFDVIKAERSKYTLYYQTIQNANHKQKVLEQDGSKFNNSY